MKKLFLFSAILMTLASCHNKDWHFDDYGTRSVYFAYQYPVRTITLGEDPSTNNSLDNQHKCKIMITTGGGYTNPDDIVIGYEVDEDMCKNIKFGGSADDFNDMDVIKAMPKSYYTLSSDRMVIPAGKLSGGVEVQLTEDFFADKDAIKNTYVIPIKLTDIIAGADTILSGKPLVSNPDFFNAEHWDVVPKNYILYCIKYINPWHATYLRHGKDNITGKTGNTGISGEIVRHNAYVEKDEVIKLSTVSMSEVKYELGIKDESGVNHPYNVILKFDENNNCTVSSDTEGCTITPVADKCKFVSKGEKNSWGAEDRDAIYLEYDVDIENIATCHTTDTLVVRNRGVVMELFTPVTE